MAEKIAWAIVGVVVVVWIATTAILPFLIAGYTPPPSIGTVMGSLAGGAAAYLFAKRAEKKDDRRSDDDDDLSGWGGDE